MDIKFFKNSSIFSITALVTSGLGFITLPIYTRYLSPSDYGILTLFLLFGTVVSNLISIGLMSSSYRYYFEYKNNLQLFKIFNSTNIFFNSLTFIIIGVLIFYLSTWISINLFDSKISPLLLQLSYISGCLNYFIQFFLHLLSAQLKTAQFAILSISKVVIDISFSFYFIFSHSLTYMARINGILISQLIIIIISIFFLKELLGLRFSLKYLKESLLFAYPNVPSSLIGLTYQSFDKVMITNYKNLDSLGHYNIGEKFAGVLKVSADSINRVFNPYFQDKAHEGSLKSKHDIVKRFYSLSGLFLLGAFTIICFSEELIKIFTTEEYYPSMYIAPIFVFYYLFGSILSMISINQIMFGKKLIYQLPVSIISLITNILLNIILIPKYGAIGAVIATANAALISDSLLLLFGQRAFKLPLNYKVLVGMFVLIMLLTLPVYILMLVNINIFIKILTKFILIFFLTYILLKLSIFGRNIEKIIKKYIPFLSFNI